MIDSESTHPTLLASANTMAPVLWDQDVFERNLCYHLLFEPGGLLILDTWVFSAVVLDHLKAAGHTQSLFDNALRKGLIRVAVRSEHLQSFTEIRRVLQASNLLGHYNTRQSRFVAERLDDSAQNSKRDWPVWPIGMGARFDELVGRRVLDWQKVSAQLSGETLQKNPQIAEFMRRCEGTFFRDVLNARESLRAQGEGHGLRASEIVRASARRMLGSATDVKNIEMLFTLMKREGASPQLIQDAKWFYKIIVDLYDENMARSLQALPSVPSYDALSRVFLDSEFSNVPEESNSGEILDLPVRLPPRAALVANGGDLIFRARQSDEFDAYENALRRWRLNPASERIAGDLLVSVQRYAERIAADAGDTSYQELYQIGLARPDSLAVDTGLRLARAAARSAALAPFTGGPAGVLLALSAEVLNTVSEHTLKPISEWVKMKLYLRSVSSETANVALNKRGPPEVILPNPRLKARTGR